MGICFSALKGEEGTASTSVRNPEAEGGRMNPAGVESIFLGLDDPHDSLFPNAAQKAALKDKMRTAKELQLEKILPEAAPQRVRTPPTELSQAQTPRHPGDTPAVELDDELDEYTDIPMVWSC